MKVLLALLALSCLASAHYSTFHTIQGREGAPSGWRVSGDPHPDEKITFSIHLKQCNLDILTAKLFAVSDPDSSEYGQYLSSKEVTELVSCGNNAKNEVIAWLQFHQIKNFKVVSNAIQVTASVAVAEKLFQTSFEEYTHVKGIKAVRQIGPVSVPEEVKEHISLITGISEFFHDTKFKPIRSKSRLDLIRSLSTRLDDNDDWDPNQFNVSDPLINPRRLRQMYGIPPTQMGSSPSNSFGIAAFENGFDEMALCNFQFWNNLEDGVDWEWTGPKVANDEIESNLDIQYSTAIGAGIHTIFANHASGQWVLDWAQESVASHTENGPWVWSVSYGWPEFLQCATLFNQTLITCPVGYDYKKYIEATDTEFQKLGVMGVSILISSGDDGSPGFAWNCPVDPAKPVNGMECSSFFDGDCQCAEIVITATVGKEKYTCMWPIGAAQDDCYQIFEAQVEGGLCTELVEKHLQNGTKWESNKSCTIGVSGVTNSDAAPSFWSECTCEQLTEISTQKEGKKCSIQGYIYDANNGEMFFPDYPAASPYVTSVGATALQFNDQFCQDTSVLPEVYAAGSDAAGFGGGGGFSSFQPMPSYQTAAVTSYLASNSKSLPPQQTFNPGNRAYPDVAMNGHNYMVHNGLSSFIEGVFPELGLQGAIMAVGGTSASAPTLAGLISLVNDIQLSKNRPTLGFLNPALYKFARTNPQVFSDVTPHTQSLFGNIIEEGSSTRCTSSYCCEYGFPVTTGWDAGTGLGTINFAELVKAVDSVFADKESPATAY